jgi:hypothetical protein
MVGDDASRDAQIGNGTDQHPGWNAPCIDGQVQRLDRCRSTIQPIAAGVENRFGQCGCLQSCRQLKRVLVWAGPLHGGRPVQDIGGIHLEVALRSFSQERSQDGLLPRWKGPPTGTPWPAVVLQIPHRDRGLTLAGPGPLQNWMTCGV